MRTFPKSSKKLLLSIPFLENLPFMNPLLKARKSLVPSSPPTIRFRKGRYRPGQSCLFSLLLLLIVPGCGDSQKTGDFDHTAQIESGITAFRMFDFERAYKILAPVQPKLETGSEVWSQATYTLALAAWHRTPPSEESTDEAIVLLQDLVATVPNSSIAANALLDLGRIAEVSDYRNDEPDLELAREYYEQVRAEYPDTDASIRASLYLAQSFAQTFDPALLEEAVALLQETLAAHPDSEWTGLIGQYQSHLIAFYLDDPAGAIEPYEIAVEAGLPRQAREDVSLWQLGILAQQADRPMVAARAFSQIIEDHPLSIYGNMARERLIEIAEDNPSADIMIPELRGINLGR